MINKRKFINKRHLTIISTFIDTSWSPSKQMTQYDSDIAVFEKSKNNHLKRGIQTEIQWRLNAFTEF